MTFYTAKGDDGTTGLLGEGRVPKYHIRMEAIGALDEASAALGLARAQCAAQKIAPILLEAQRDLYKLMAEVAATPENAKRFHFIDEARVGWLEVQTDELTNIVEMPKEFILPGDTVGGAALSMARAIIRRAERRVVALFDEDEVVNPHLQRYLNRLSSLCFVLELFENQNAGRKHRWQNRKLKSPIRVNMTGTFINVAAILIGGTIGLIFGSRIPDRFKNTVIAGMGLFVAAMGLQMFFKSENQLIVLGALIIGALLGEWIGLEDWLQTLGQTLEKRFSRDAEPLDQTEGKPASGSRFIRGFMTASLLYCIGPMTILGSIQDGLTGDYNLLAVKSTLDGFASIAFASTLGIGVLFSSLVVLVFQGAISLLAGQLSVIVTDPMMNELTATGGVILLGLAVSNLLDIKKIRVGNFLPALAIAPLIVWVLSLF